jgi:hypothetical protein
MVRCNDIIVTKVLNLMGDTFYRSELFGRICKNID